MAPATTVRDDRRMTGTPPHRTDPYALARASAARLSELSGATFDVAIVLGSGWSAADALSTPEREILLTELGGFPAPSAPVGLGIRFRRCSALSRRKAGW